MFFFSAFQKVHIPSNMGAKLPILKQNSFSFILPTKSILTFISEVVKQKGTTETATTEEMKENCNILQHPALLSTATTKSPDKFFSNMDSNISLHPYIGNSMSTPPTSALNSGLNKQDQNVENLRTPIKEETSVTASPSFYEKENLSSTGSSSSSSSETEISRSPMSICDSSIETSPESTDCTTISPLSGPTDNSTPLHPPQPASP